MGQLIELGQGILHRSQPEEASAAGLAGMVLQSAGPHRHAVSLGFHDSQMRRRAVLIQTGWDERLGTDAYWEPGPYLAEEFVFRLIRAGVKLVGVDFAKVEEPAYTSLVAKNVLIVEQLRDLASLPRVGFRFHAVPVSADTGRSCPVRAFAEL